MREGGADRRGGVGDGKGFEGRRKEGEGGGEVRGGEGWWDGRREA